MRLSPFRLSLTVLLLWSCQLQAQEQHTSAHIGSNRVHYDAYQNKVYHALFEDTLEHQKATFDYMFPLDLSKVSMYEYNYGVSSNYYANGRLQSQEMHAQNLPLGLQFYRYLGGLPRQLKFINGLEIMWAPNGEVIFVKRRNFNTGMYEPADTSLAVLQEWYQLLLKQDALSISNTANEFRVVSFLQDTLLYCSRKQYVSHGNWFASHNQQHPFNSGTDYEGKPCGVFTRYHYYKPFPVRTEIFDKPFDADAKLRMVLEYNQDYAYLERKQRYTRGIEDGWQVTYHRNGLPSDSFLVNMGKTGALHISIKENGKPFRILHYNANGKYEGKVKYWYSGEYGDALMQDENYHNGLREGKAWYYYANGKLKLTGKYVHDTMEGKWLWYENTGVLLKETSYVKGVKKQEKADGTCHDPEPVDKRFMQNLQSLAGEDSMYFHAGEFDYHASVWNLIDHCYADRIQWESESRYRQVFFDLVAYQFIDLEFPAKNGIIIRLNPCWHLGEESRMQTVVNYSEKYPEENMVYVEAPKAQLIVPSILTAANGKPYTLNLHASELRFTQQGLYTEEIHLTVPDSAYVGKHLKLMFHQLHVNDLKKDSNETIALQGSGMAQLYLKKQTLQRKFSYGGVSDKRLVLKLEFETADTLDQKMFTTEIENLLKADGIKGAVVKFVHEQVKLMVNPEFSISGYAYEWEDYLRIEIPRQ